MYDNKLDCVYLQDTSNNKEIETLQSQINDFRERVSILRQQLDDEEAKHKQTVRIYHCIENWIETDCGR